MRSNSSRLPAARAPSGLLPGAGGARRGSSRSGRVGAGGGHSAPRGIVSKIRPLWASRKQLIRLRPPARHADGWPMASGAPGPGLGGCQGRSRNEPSAGNIARGRAKVLTRARNAIGASSATQILFPAQARESPGTRPSIRNERGGAKGTSAFFLGNGLNKYGCRQGGEEEAESFQTRLAASGGCRRGSPRILACWQSTLRLASRARQEKLQPHVYRKPENMCLKLLLSGFQSKHIQRGSRVLFLAGLHPYKLSIWLSRGEMLGQVTRVLFTAASRGGAGAARRAKCPADGIPRVRECGRSQTFTERLYCAGCCVRCQKPGVCPQGAYSLLGELDPENNGKQEEMC